MGVRSRDVGSSLNGSLKGSRIDKGFYKLRVSNNKGYIYIYIYIHTYIHMYG